MAGLKAMKTPGMAELNNSGAKTLAVMRRVDSIKTDGDFSGLFQIKKHVLEQIVESMKREGFHGNEPLLLWKEEGVLVDGHTRLAAAKEAGLFDVPVYERSFASKEAALEAALGIQVGRRNLSDAELVIAVEKLDELKNGGRKAGDAKGERGKSSEHLAKKLGTSRSKIEKIRTIEKSADDETKAAVKSGEMSVNAAYKKTRPQKELASREANLLPSIETTATHSAPPPDISFGGDAPNETSDVLGETSDISETSDVSADDFELQGETDEVLGALQNGRKPQVTPPLDRETAIGLLRDIVKDEAHKMDDYAVEWLMQIIDALEKEVI